MFVIRPIETQDHSGLMELLKESGHGLTSLPKDDKIIEEKILHAVRSFEQMGEKPNGEVFLFVMEEIFTGKLVGISGIISKIGGFQAYYFYRLKEEIYNSKMLGVVDKKINSLHFEKTHAGPAEICSLFLAPEYRNSQNGRFLSLSRFHFMHQKADFFEDEVIAEMRGQVNDDGRSPFWDAVGAKFFDIDFVQADFLTVKSKSFIDELLPKHPIIIDLLPKNAQDVVAQVHPHTVPAKRILEQEGFDFSGLVGIFEPGPVLHANLREVRTYKRNKILEIGEISEDRVESDVFIISTTTDKFKACLGNLIELDDGKAKISAVAASALKLRLGDKIRYSTLRPNIAEQKELI